jgi:hypothetical protein
MKQPWKRQRFHYNAYGEPKRNYNTEFDAIIACKELNKNRFCTDEQFVHPYQCRLCKQWHVGRHSQAHKDTTLYYEIGDRAYYNLVVENSKEPDKRIAGVLTRFKFIDVFYGIPNAKIRNKALASR